MGRRTAPDKGKRNERDMSDEYDKEDCRERHKDIWAEMKSLRNQINGFYVLAIATLAAVVGTIVGGK